MPLSDGEHGVGDGLPRTVDAVVIGAGVNGLVAANILADHGWRVAVLEHAAEPGGSVRSAAVTAPGFINDLFSSFYPLALASPVMLGLELEREGLQWSHAPVDLAQPSTTRGVVLSRDIDVTAASLDACAPGDGSAWRQLMQRWHHISGPLIDAMMSPFPPVRAGGKLVARAGVDELAWWAQTALMPVAAFAAENFRSEQAAQLLTGNALHADFTPETAGSAIFGVLMAGLAQEVGFPAAVGGAQQITSALVQRLHRRGGSVHCGQSVGRVVLDGGRAVGVETVHGERVGAERAVVADVVVTKLFGDLVPRAVLPRRWRQGLARFQPGWATFKVDWALDAPIPWRDEQLRGAGVVHLGLSMDEVSRFTRQVSNGWVPREPFLLVGSMTTADPTRSPSGTEAAWAYTHVPQVVRGDAGDDGLTGCWDAQETERFATRVEERIESIAPGFCRSIIGRHVLAPPGFEQENPSLIRGAINEGTAQLHQELVLRPVPGLARAGTPVPGLFLGSASAHPGGGVHGGPGSNAARAALAQDRVRRLRRTMTLARLRSSS